MSKTAYNKIVAKIEKLTEYLRILEELQKISKKNFIDDYRFHGLAERYFQLAIEAMLDAGKLIIIDGGFRKPEDGHDIFSVLCENKIINQSLLSRLSGITGFRNVLVHDYEKIDRNRVYDKLQNNLEDFNKFKKAILRYLKKQ